MKNSIVVLLLLSIQFSFAQKDIYESPNFNELSKNHTELAILPFFTDLDLEKKMTIDIYSIKELCKILDVDGIISGNTHLNILLSDGIPSEFSFIDYILGDADYGRIGIKISDGKTGKLLWRYEKKINKKSGKNTKDLIDLMMKQATKKFPYDKERVKTKK